MRKETDPNAQNARERRLLRTVFPLHTRASRHHQGRGEAPREHDRLCPGANRRLPDHVRAAANSGGSVGSRHEEPETSDAPRIHSPPTGAAVPNAPRGASRGRKKREALTLQLVRGGPWVRRWPRFRLLRRRAQQCFIASLRSTSALATPAPCSALLDPLCSTQLSRSSNCPDLLRFPAFPAGLACLLRIESPYSLQPRSYLAPLSHRPAQQQFHYQAALRQLQGEIKHVRAHKSQM